MMKNTFYFTFKALFEVFVMTFLGIWNPELENRVKKPSYTLWRHKTELSQIVTSLLFFH